MSHFNYSRPGRAQGYYEVNSKDASYTVDDYLARRRIYMSKAKLSNVAEYAGLMAGFAVVASIELQINSDGEEMVPWLIAFGVVTSLLVATCMTAVTIAYCILPQLEAMAKTSHIFGTNQWPHDKMLRFIDISWILTNTASLFLFSLQIIIMAWIKYTFFSLFASIIATVIMVPILLTILVFGIVFYLKIVRRQYTVSSDTYQKLKDMDRGLERRASLPSFGSRRNMSNRSRHVYPRGSIMSHSSGRSLYVTSPSSPNHSPESVRNPRMIALHSPTLQERQNLPEGRQSDQAVFFSRNRESIVFGEFDNTLDPSRIRRNPSWEEDSVQTV